MDIRFQYILLKRVVINIAAAAVLGLGSLCFADELSSEPRELEFNSELFDVGIFTGIVNIADFPGAFVFGANVTFKASEDFFLQYNYMQADVAKSAFENNPAFTTLDLGGDRVFKHYDLLIGYNIFQGEFYTAGQHRNLSSLYLVGGVGDTDFGGEKNFTYTLGLGYQIEFRRKYLLRFDYRDYIYRTNLVVGSEGEDSREDTARNTQISVGVGYLF